MKFSHLTLILTVACGSAMALTTPLNKKVRNERDVTCLKIRETLIEIQAAMSSEEEKRQLDTTNIHFVTSPDPFR